MQLVPLWDQETLRGQVNLEIHQARYDWTKHTSLPSVDEARSLCWPGKKLMYWSFAINLIELLQQSAGHFLQLWSFNLRCMGVKLKSFVRGECNPLSLFKSVTHFSGERSSHGVWAKGDRYKRFYRYEIWNWHTHREGQALQSSISLVKILCIDADFVI